MALASEAERGDHRRGTLSIHRRTELKEAYWRATRGLIPVDIYDVTGRLVRRLVRGGEEAGRHAVEWDGMNENGSRVAAGVYFCRLATERGNTRGMREMVVLK